MLNLTQSLKIQMTRNSHLVLSQYYLLNHSILQVDFDYPELNVTANFIPLVAIPLDVSSCSVTTPPSTNNGTTHIPSQPSSQKISKSVVHNVVSYMETYSNI